MHVDEAPIGRGPLWSTGAPPERMLEAAPSRVALPVRLTTSDAVEAHTDVRGGEGDVSGAGDGPGHQALPDEPEPDAVARGWVIPPGGSRVDAIFVLAGTSLGIGRVERATSPVWLNLDDLVNLDAIGDPVDGIAHVEILMDDDRIIGAGWPEDFCAAVVDVLMVTTGRANATPGSPADTSHGPAAHPEDPEPIEAAAVPTWGAPAAPPATPSPAPHDSSTDIAPDTMPDTPAATTAPSDVAPPLDVAPTPAPDAPATAPAPHASPAGALELEDVVYLGGFPGQSKRRKKCTVGMSRAAIDLKGPGDLHFRVGWDVVRTIEVQNSDEARFRMNTKIHRDASALVIECDQGVTILLEARDCPTIALRSAIAQLLDGLPVVVV